MAAPDSYPFEIGTAFRYGWDKFKLNVPTLLLAFLLVSVAGLVVFLLKPVEGFWAGLLWQLLDLVIAAVVAMGWIRISLLLADGKKAEPLDVLRFRNVLSYVVAAIVFSIGFAFGLALLIVPGIWFGVTFGFFAYNVVDRDAGAMESLSTSFEQTKGHRGYLFLYGLAVLGLNLLGLLALGVGLLITIPVSLLAHAYVYRKLNQQEVFWG